MLLKFVGTGFGIRIRSILIQIRLKGAWFDWIHNTYCKPVFACFSLFKDSRFGEFTKKKEVPKCRLWIIVTDPTNHSLCPIKTRAFFLFNIAWNFFLADQRSVTWFYWINFQLIISFLTDFFASYFFLTQIEEHIE